jgi:hypothetical protein
MGTSKKDKETIKKLLEDNTEVQKEVKELGISVQQLIDRPDFNQLYAEFKKKNQGIPDIPPPTPTCGAHSHWNGTACVCDPGFKDDGSGNCVEDTTTPPPPPSPPVEGNVLYDSNRDGHWDNGTSRLVKKSEGNIGPNGKGIFTAASGNPELEILGDGTAILRTTGAGNYGRIYICCLNYDSTLQLSFQLSKNVDNLSLKLRSRHQEGGADSHRAGGEGWALGHKDWDSKRENFHNDHDPNGSENLSKSLSDGQWYTAKFTCKDDGANKIRLIGEVDYGSGFVKEMDLVDSGAPAYFFDKALIAENSYLWIRLNSTDNASGPNEVKLKDVSVTAI